MSLELVTGGFADTDKATAIVYKLTDSSGNNRVLPDAATGVGSIPITHVYNHIQVLEDFRICQNIIKGNKTHIKGRTA